MSTKPNVVIPADRAARLKATIDDYRHERGWSVARLAQEVGVDPMTINALRWGQTANPSDKTAWNLDRLLGYEKGQGIHRIIAGQTPVRIDSSSSQDATDLAIAEIRAKKHLSEQQKRVFIDMLLSQRDALLDQATEADRRQRDTA